MKGLYVTRWHGGTKSEKEVDDLIAFCEKAEITDLFIHKHEDIAVNDNWDYLGYVLRNRGKMNIHAWISLSMGRDNEYTRERMCTILKIPYIPKPILTTEESIAMRKPIDRYLLSRGAQVGTTPIDPTTLLIAPAVATKPRDEGTIVNLNPNHVESRAYIIKRLTNLLIDYPDLYGIHFDKLQSDAGKLIQDVREICKDKYLTIPVPYSADPMRKYWVKWDVDEVIPMFVNYYRTMFDKVDLSEYKHICLGCFGCDLKKTEENIQRCKELGVQPIYYSYGAYSYRPTETREQFMKVIQNASI